MKNNIQNILNDISKQLKKRRNDPTLIYTNGVIEYIMKKSDYEKACQTQPYMREFKVKPSKSIWEI
jgi:hypothetical protein